MRTTIDKSGRIVIPKPLREQLGFGTDQELEMTVRDGRLEIEPPPTPVRLEERAGHLVAVADREMPTLTVEQVRETLENVRR